MVILASAPCVAQNISGLWRSHRLRIVKVCAISKRVLERSPQSCAVWDCATPWPDRHWPTPTSYVTGASGLILRLSLSNGRASFISKMISVLTLPIPSMRSTASLLIYAFPCFRGPIFVPPKARSKCRHCLICADRYRVLSIFQTVNGRCPGSRSHHARGRGHLRHGSRLCRFPETLRHSSSRSLLCYPHKNQHEVSQGLFPSGAGQDNRGRFPTKALRSMGFIPNKIIPSTYAVSRSVIQRPVSVLCS